jgi:hypothetical protein
MEKGGLGLGSSTPFKLQPQWKILFSTNAVAALL